MPGPYLGPSMPNGWTPSGSSPRYEELWTEEVGTGGITNPIQLYNSLLEEQQAYNAHQEEREDSAYQRMVADMQKAGLNPWTGVASGGSASSPQTPAQASALNGLLNILGYNVDKTDKRNKAINQTVNTALHIALPILALFGG